MVTQKALCEDEFDRLATEAEAVHPGGALGVRDWQPCCRKNHKSTRRRTAQAWLSETDLQETCSNMTSTLKKWVSIKLIMWKTPILYNKIIKKEKY